MLRAMAVRSRTGSVMDLVLLVLPFLLRLMTEQVVSVKKEAFSQEKRHSVFACQAMNLLQLLAVLHVQWASTRTQLRTTTATAVTC